MAFGSNDDDSHARLALGLVLAVAGVVVAAVVATMVVRTLRHGHASLVAAQQGGAQPVPAMAAATGIAAVGSPEAGRIEVGDGVVKFYFASGKADLATGAQEALKHVVEQVMAGGRVVISGFHDASGDAAANEALARQRALAVRDALLEAGAEAGRIALEKPAVTAGGADDAEARRVEVAIRK